MWGWQLAARRSLVPGGLFIIEIVVIVVIINSNRNNSNHRHNGNDSNNSNNGNNTPLRGIIGAKLRVTWCHCVVSVFPLALKPGMAAASHGCYIARPECHQLRQRHRQLRSICDMACRGGAVFTGGKAWRVPVHCADGREEGGRGLSPRAVIEERHGHYYIVLQAIDVFRVQRLKP